MFHFMVSSVKLSTLFENMKHFLADYINICIKALCFFMFRYVPVCPIIKVGMFHIFQKLQRELDGREEMKGKVVLVLRI